MKKKPKNESYNLYYNEVEELRKNAAGTQLQEEECTRRSGYECSESYKWKSRTQSTSMDAVNLPYTNGSSLFQNTGSI